jgi:O-antigen ligase
LFGVGYGGYWGLQDEFIYTKVGVHEAHSGYLDVYLVAGMVGITLLLAFLLAHYIKTIRILNDAYDWGLFGVSFLIMTLLHNYTESDFLSPSNYLWNSMIFLTVVFSSRHDHSNFPRSNAGTENSSGWPSELTGEFWTPG